MKRTRLRARPAPAVDLLDDHEPPFTHPIMRRTAALDVELMRKLVTTFGRMTEAIDMLALVVDDRLRALDRVEVALQRIDLDQGEDARSIN